jgi:hypothetical protein
MAVQLLAGPTFPQGFKQETISNSNLHTTSAEDELHSQFNDFILLHSFISFPNSTAIALFYGFLDSTSTTI